MYVSRASTSSSLKERLSAREWSRCLFPGGGELRQCVRAPLSLLDGELAGGHEGGPTIRGLDVCSGGRSLHQTQESGGRTFSESGQIGRVLHEEDSGEERLGTAGAAHRYRSGILARQKTVGLADQSCRRHFFPDVIFCAPPRAERKTAEAPLL
jgi:hypothetical protein